MSALKYWLWLSSLKQLSPSGVISLIDTFGTPENVFFAENAELRASGVLGKRQMEEIAPRSLDAAERILEQCGQLSLRVMTLQDADYPERLKNIHTPPSVLYIKGRLPMIDEEAALAVVGARKATAYGLQAANRLSYGLARAGMLIVSGLAEGIDAAAHSGALQAGSSTVAVLGCGADIVYPAKNRRLYEDIAAVGALVTEYPPGIRPLGGHFPARNRIISGFSLGTMVVEAGEKSGALITVRHALEQGRDVFAAPGNIDVPESVGSNQLLREGAQIVTEPADVLREYAARFPHKIAASQSPAPPADNGKDTTTKETLSAPPHVFDLGEAIRDLPPESKAIMIALASSDRHVDEIIEQTGMPASQALRELTMLELSGAVRALPGKRFAINS